LESVRKLAIASEDWGSYLAATTLRVFAYQALADAFGETPYTEGLDISNTAPHYDEGQTIYDGFLAELDEALSHVSSASPVCKNFLFGTSTAKEWIQFANALKLRILMRESNVKDVKSAVAALIAENNFPTEDVAYGGFWTNESGKANPLFSEETATYFGSTQVNITANISIMQTMISSDDARVSSVFAKNNSGNYTGSISGSNFSTSTYNASYWCRPVFTYDMPVFLITVAETEFFLAEYYARYGSAGDAKAHYEAAIEASFETLGASDADEIYNAQYPYNNAEYQKIIGIQKWVALAGVNNFEAWCELRRLKYPAFGTVSGSDLFNVGSGVYSPNLYVPGTLYTPIQGNPALGANKILQRLKYAEVSTSRNANAPEQKGDGEPVFWAK
jgi:hypothetical protein